MRIKLQDKTQWHGKFLWWPRVVDGELVWLESVWRKQERLCGLKYTQYKLTVPKEI